MAMLPVDRELLRQIKIEKIQKKIQEVESQMNERAHLLNRLEQLNEIEKLRSERIVDRVAKGRPHFKINQEMDRLKIDEARSYSISPLPPAVLSDLLSHRTKEFTNKQLETANQIRYLAVERQRLQDARQRLKEKRNNVLYAPSPVDSEFGDASLPVSPEESSFETVRSPDSYVRQQMADLPYALHRIWKLREDVDRDYRKKLKPYNGELGLESYANWQLGDYVIVRKLVEDFVEDFLLQYIKPGISHYERDMQSAVMKANDEEWNTAAEALAERRALTLVAEELLLEQTHVISREVTKEVFHIYGTFHNRVDQFFMKAAEVISTGKDDGRHPTDPVYNLVTKAYFTFQGDRNRHRKDVWKHSQQLQLMKKDEQEPEEEEEREITDGDVEKINFDHITPTNLRKYEVSTHDPPDVKERKRHAEVYVRRELAYWKGVSAEVFRLTLGARCRGTSVTSTSPDQRFVAVGTVHGDIIVYDTLMEPWRPIRVIQNTSNYDDSVTDISWSLDSSRLVSINRKGSLQVWAFDGGNVRRSDLKSLNIQADSKGYVPQQLARIVVLDVDQHDFTFQQGPFAEQETLVGKYGPVKAAFFPSFTFMGTQHGVCVALDNGDMLKCNLEPLTAPPDRVDDDIVYSEAPYIFHQNIYNEAHELNLIGQNLEAELFREHRNPIIHIGFIDNMNSMVTVDKKGYINRWKYDSNYQFGFGWFIPEKKFQLDMKKSMYTPSTTEKPKLIFTDSLKSKRRRPSQVTEERRKIQKKLKDMSLGDPWHEEFLDDENLVTRVYRPRGVITETGAMFHVVVRYQNTEQICTYLTRIYKPVSVKCTKMLAVTQTPTGRELVFILLFPKYPPKEAHMTVVVVDIRSMTPRDVRLDVHVTETEFTKLQHHNDIIACAVSQVFGPTGSDYLFILFNGRLRCVSLSTGKLVLRVEDLSRPSYFGGCSLDEKLLPLPEDSEITTVCINGKIHAIMFSKRMTSIYVLRLQDENDHETKRFMWKAFNLWNETLNTTPSEMRTDPIHYDLEDLQYKEVQMRSVVMEIVDEALMSCGVMHLTEEKIKTHKVQDKIAGYLNLEEKVNSQNVLQD